MKMFKKSTLSLALTAAMIGGVAMTQQAFANLDVNPGVAANISYVSNNTLGQAMIFPYYTVRGGKESIINIFNTSDRTVTAKVRFHESHNSRDVLDFQLVLSPFDKWSGTISAAADGGALFKTRDNTCTVPQIPSTGVPLNASAYNSASYADADADQSNDRLQEGYVEVIAMGDAEPANQGFSGPTGAGAAYVAGNVGNVAYNSTHVNGVPRSCDNVDTAFTVNTGNNALGGQGAATSGTGAFTAANAAIFPLNVAGGNGSPMAAAEFDGMGVASTSTATVAAADRNPLRGALTIVDGANGVGFGTAAVAIANFANAGLTLGVNAAGNNTANLITAQRLPYFLEPTLASRDDIWTVTGLPVVEAAMTAGTVINEWANNPINGANTDWVIQFPTKSYHVDIPYVDNATAAGCSDSNIQAATNKWRGNGWTGPVTGACLQSAGATSVPATEVLHIAPFATRFTATGSPIEIQPNLIDKEERQATAVTGVSFSPAQPTNSTTSIPWESNVVTFSGLGGKSVLASSSPELILNPTVTIPGSDTNGQALLTFGSVLVPTPLPVIGFVAKERDQGGSSNYGQIMQHSYQ